MTTDEMKAELVRLSKEHTKWETLLRKTPFFFGGRRGKRWEMFFHTCNQISQEMAELLDHYSLQLREDTLEYTRALFLQQQQQIYDARYK